MPHTLHIHIDPYFMTFYGVSRHKEISHLVESLLLDRKTTEMFDITTVEPEVYLVGANRCVLIGVIKDHEQGIIITIARNEKSDFEGLFEGKTFLELVIGDQCLKRVQLSSGMIHGEQRNEICN